MGLILTIDPGRKPGYVVLDTAVLRERRFIGRKHLPVVVAAGLTVQYWGVVTHIVAEEQWLHGAKNKDAILTLAAIRGWQHCEACRLHPGAKPETIAVRAWRDAVHGNRVDKETLQNRCLGSLFEDEVRILGATGASPARLPDLYDAVLIGWGWFLAGGKPWKAPP